MKSKDKAEARFVLRCWRLPPCWHSAPRLRRAAPVRAMGQDRAWDAARATDQGMGRELGRAPDPLLDLAAAAASAWDRDVEPARVDRPDVGQH